MYAIISALVASHRKVCFLWVSKDIPNLLAPTSSHERPPLHRKISRPKSLDLGSLFSCLMEKGQVSVCLLYNFSIFSWGQKLSETFSAQSFSGTLRVTDVCAENRGRPRQKVGFPAVPVTGRNLLTTKHLGTRVWTSAGKSSPKSLSLCYLDSRRLYCRTPEKIWRQETIRGLIFSEMIRIQARKSELQAESRSYGPKVGDTAEPNHQEKGPEWGSAASTETPLKAFSNPPKIYLFFLP